MEMGMKLVEENKYCLILEQMREIHFNTLFARSVLERMAHGKVYTDDANNPKTVFIAHEYGMSLLFGDTENSDFNSDLAEYMLNKNGQRTSVEWLQVYPDKWNEKLQEILEGKIIDYSKLFGKYSQTELDTLIETSRTSHVIQWGRVNFAYMDNSKITKSEPGYDIKQIDSEIYDRLEGMVMPKYFWKSKEAFLSEGIGYVLMKGLDIVSIAFSSCKFEKELEIGVETSKVYRGKGLTQLACKAMLDDCKTNGLLPIWACRKENIQSYRLAKSLGFEESLILPYYELVK